jgi:3-oxoacyl-ACP reductase-like protein
MANRDDGNPVDDSDKDVRSKYEKAIMGHAGVRFFSELLSVLALSCLMLSIRV